MGLLTMEEMKSRQEEAVREREMILARKNRDELHLQRKEEKEKEQKKKKQQEQIKTLSFNMDEEEDEDEEDSEEEEKVLKGIYSLNIAFEFEISIVKTINFESRGGKVRVENETVGQKSGC